MTIVNSLVNVKIRAALKVSKEARNLDRIKGPAILRLRLLEGGELPDDAKRDVEEIILEHQVAANRCNLLAQDPLLQGHTTSDVPTADYFRVLGECHLYNRSLWKHWYGDPSRATFVPASMTKRDILSRCRQAAGSTKVTEDHKVTPFETLYEGDWLPFEITATRGSRTLKVFNRRFESGAKLGPGGSELVHGVVGSLNATSQVVLLRAWVELYIDGELVREEPLQGKFTYIRGLGFLLDPTMSTRRAPSPSNIIDSYMPRPVRRRV